MGIGKAILLLQKQRRAVRKEFQELEASLGPGARVLVHHEDGRLWVNMTIVDPDLARGLFQGLASNNSGRVRQHKLGVMVEARDDAQQLGRLLMLFAPADWATIGIEWTFRFVSILVPKRLADEEIGDALEVIAEQLECSPARWPVYRLVAITLFWLLVNAIRYRPATPLAGPVGRKRTPGE